jgi:uncharacterized membrane protein
VDDWRIFAGIIAGALTVFVLGAFDYHLVQPDHPNLADYIYPAGGLVGAAVAGIAGTTRKAAVFSGIGALGVLVVITTMVVLSTAPAEAGGALWGFLLMSLLALLVGGFGGLLGATARAYARERRKNRR